MKLVNVEDLKVLVAVESNGEIRYGKLVTDLFDDIQTVDAEPVRHGKWINEFASPLKCSSCGIVSKANEITLRTDFKFCPYCGAKMDGEKE